ncbi:hypothetical protein Hypma_013305 [Hypsizygus marmoreus]|uniref:Uncharacterized protein n=1 Tax=Hypsizygus marmoreus TaxID=39966 RepID=A0A369JGS5_HYPMA|nr:hypothetical protein Hypma_013305 [Hypsizygus marmoreus]
MIPVAGDWCKDERLHRTTPTPQESSGRQADNRTAASSTLTRLGRHCTTTPASTHAGGIGWNKEGERRSGMHRVHRYALAAVSPHSPADVVAADVQTTTNLCSSSSNLNLGSDPTILRHAMQEP